MIDITALKKERETLNNDKRKGRAYLDLQLGNCIRTIEDQDAEIEALKDRLKLAYLVAGATMAVSAMMILVVWVTR